MQAAVTSHVRDLSLHHGIRKQPSGRLPPERTRPDDSFSGWNSCRLQSAVDAVIQCVVFISTTRPGRVIHSRSPRGRGARALGRHRWRKYVYGLNLITHTQTTRGFISPHWRDVLETVINRRKLTDAQVNPSTQRKRYLSPI